MIGLRWLHNRKRQTITCTKCGKQEHFKTAQDLINYLRQTTPQDFTCNKLHTNITNWNTRSTP